MSLYFCKSIHVTEENDSVRQRLNFFLQLWYLLIEQIPKVK